jgi:hypothetical protein
MKKYFFIIPLALSYYNLLSQTDSRQAVPVSEGTQQPLIKSAEPFGNTGALHTLNKTCFLCEYNIFNRIPGEPVKQYAATCVINFMPGFESASTDNWDAFIDPKAVRCDSANCTYPANTIIPEFVKNDPINPNSIALHGLLYKPAAFKSMYPLQTTHKRDVNWHTILKKQCDLTKL